MAVLCGILVAAPPLVQRAVSDIEEWQWRQKRRADLYKRIPFNKNEIGRKIVEKEDGTFRLYRILREENGEIRNGYEFAEAKETRREVRNRNLEKIKKRQGW